VIGVLDFIFACRSSTDVGLFAFVAGPFLPPPPYTATVSEELSARRDRVTHRAVDKRAAPTRNIALGS